MLYYSNIFYKRSLKAINLDEVTAWRCTGQFAVGSKTSYKPGLIYFLDDLCDPTLMDPHFLAKVDNFSYPSLKEKDSHQEDCSQ